MLCDSCKKREATVHTTVCSSNAGDEPKRRDLCGECFESFNPTEASGITKAWEAGCQYCGGPPEIGGADPLATIGGIHKLRCMCRPCAEEYGRFLQLKMPGFGTVTMTKEQIAKIKTYDIPAIFTEAEEHMKKWVADRGSQ
jgi:protein-arginine kinase activator protein McsA